ncbi:hypothetical protein N431DRAFT_452761 [Stipitochalara longipes BDJ]|nr:hypothetical protein N431DRAFT_452761 [Stipitochalara longipes BDJ]
MQPQTIFVAFLMPLASLAAPISTRSDVPAARDLLGGEGLPFIGGLVGDLLGSAQGVVKGLPPPLLKFSAREVVRDLDSLNKIQRRAVDESSDIHREPSTVGTLVNDVFEGTLDARAAQSQPQGVPGVLNTLRWRPRLAPVTD